jgi:putative membrane protein
MRFTPTLLAATTALALTACAQTETAEESSASAEPAAPVQADAAAMPADAAADPAAPTDAQGFVNAMAASDAFEIASGRLAQDKGSSPAVKDFGRMLVQEHTKSTAELKAAAGEAKLTVAPEMTAKQRSDLTALEGAGANFDQLFKTQQIAAHEQALALLRAQAQNGTVAPLKAFAEKTAPVVEKHLAEARKLP